MYSLDTHPGDEPAVQIADLEHRLTNWLTEQPAILADLMRACRGNQQLEHVGKTLARMTALNKSFDAESTYG